MNIQPQSPTGKLFQMSALVAGILTLMLATRPYDGIWHDARLYTVQALRLLHPENYSLDLFFLYGSQDDYTLFTNVYAYFINWLGITDAAFVLLLFGQVVWIVAAYLLLRRLLPSPLYWLALTATLIFLRYYSDFNIFMVRESFVTSRIYAEGFTLLSLNFLLSRKYILSGGMLLAGFLFHPLVALPGLIFAFFWLFTYWPKMTISIGLVSVSLVLLLAFLGIPPADSLLTAIDPAWFEQTNARSPWLYTSNWGVPYWNSILLVLSFLLYASLTLTGQLATTARAIFLGTIVAVFVTWFASKTLASVLLIQLQLWRILWLTQLLALAIAVFMTWKVIREKENYLPLLGFLTSYLYLDSSGGIIAMAVCGFSLLRPHIKIDNKWPLLLICCLLLQYIALEVFYLAGIAPILFQGDIFSLGNGLNNHLQHTALIGFSAACIMAALTLRRAVIQAVTATLSITLFILAASFWGIQLKSLYALDAIDSGLVQIQNKIKPGQTVYWSDNPYQTWFSLGRSSYYSSVQTSGIVFNRLTSLEGQRRHTHLDPLYKNPEPLLTRSGQREPKEQSEITSEDIKVVCSDPKLDWLAVKADFPGSKLTFSSDQNGKLYFYNCSEFRQKLATTNE